MRSPEPQTLTSSLTPNPYKVHSGCSLCIRVHHVDTHLLQCIMGFHFKKGNTAYRGIRSGTFIQGMKESVLIKQKEKKIIYYRKAH